ncbi:MAG: glycosyltransferase [Puniceicoccales bacterium]|jgi:glycosyltransferase involved in cell wall biosynthesis|nr:glycosyltransferase [Puniceicoccales bacterium]
MRIAYLFTCFPVATETFLQREIRAMRERGDVEIEIWSLWHGKPEWEGLRVRRYPFAAIFRVIFLKLPLWAWRRPGALRRVWAAYMAESTPSLLNIGENLLGLAFALDTAGHFRANPPELFHAVWGTMPAAAAWMLNELTGIPFSTGAHAYDLFRHGGDWTLRHKLARAHLVHTTTEAARRRLLDLGVPPARVHLIRRGLDTLPQFREDLDAPLRRASADGTPLRLLSVGRLVPKKGFQHQIAIYEALRTAGIAFTARIAGEGPLLDALRQRAETLGLANTIVFTGKQEYAQIAAEYATADIFLFTGVVAEDGDRDGLPNVIPEAMAHGIPVITSAVSGTTEAVVDGATGQVVTAGDTAGWIAAIRRLHMDAAFRERTRRAARNWVEREFCAHANAARLSTALRQIGTRTSAADESFGLGAQTPSVQEFVHNAIGEAD